jgi:hypothetical protein
MTDRDQLQAFVAFSAEVTGFTEFELHGTGHPEEFRSTVAEAVGDEILVELLEPWSRLFEEAQGERSVIQTRLRHEIFSDPKLGPVGRNIVKLWYVGIWYELPPEWIDAFGALEKNYTFTVSPSAYTEALLWPAIGANPPGVKGPGYASWARPPRIPGVTSTSTEPGRQAER